MMVGAGVEPGHAVAVPGTLPVGIWPGTRGTAALAARPEAAALFA
jgi:hypothetical protein